MRHLRRLLALLSVLAVTACGSAVPAGDDALDAAPYPPDALVLQVSRTGGFVPVGHAFRSLPSVSVYGDGRVVTPGAQVMVYPGPALPAVQRGRLSADQVQQLVEDGRAAVDGEADLGQPPVADAPTTVVVVGAGDDRVTASALALDELPGGPDVGLTPPQQQARERLSAFVQQVEQAATQAATQAYEAERLGVLVLPVDPSAAAQAGPGTATVTWPGPPLEEAPAGAQSCVVVSGEQLDAVRAAAAEATEETAWADGGRSWQLAFRPLLPHEQTCDDVFDTGAPPSA